MLDATPEIKTLENLCFRQSARSPEDRRNLIVAFSNSNRQAAARCRAYWTVVAGRHCSCGMPFACENTEGKQRIGSPNHLSAHPVLCAQRSAGRKRALECQYARRLHTRNNQTENNDSIRNKMGPHASSCYCYGAVLRISKAFICCAAAPAMMDERRGCEHVRCDT